MVSDEEYIYRLLATINKKERYKKTLFLCYNNKIKREKQFAINQSKTISQYH